MSNHVAGTPLVFLTSHLTTEDYFKRFLNYRCDNDDEDHDRAPFEFDGPCRFVCTVMLQERLSRACRQVQSFSKAQGT